MNTNKQGITLPPKSHVFIPLEKQFPVNARILAQFPGTRNFYRATVIDQIYDDYGHLAGIEVRIDGWGPFTIATPFFKVHCLAWDEQAFENAQLAR